MARRLDAGQFFGDTRTRRTAGAIFSEIVHGTPRVIEEHTHTLPFFILLLSGEYVECSRNVTVRYQPFTLCFHSRMMSHSDVIGPAGARLFSIELDHDWDHVVEANCRAPSQLTELCGGEPVWLAVRLHREFGKGADASMQEIESLLFKLCAQLSATNGKKRKEPDWLLPIISILHERFTEKLDVRVLAREASVHPSHLSRAFHQVMGRPLTDYVAGLRIQRVTRQIADGTSPLQTIALEAGFADQSHMTREFRRFTGTSPANYRRQFRLRFDR